MVYSCIKKIQSHFKLPCLLCDRKTSTDVQLCDDCIDALPRVINPCQLCALPIPASQTLCGRCLSSNPSYSKIHAPFLYDGHIKTLISQFKFSGELTAGHILSTLLAQYFHKQCYTKPQLLLPAPLHKTRLIERQFNQSAEITKHLSRQLQIPWKSQNLIKTKSTQAQNSLTKKQRLQNVKGCFYYKKEPEYQHIAIIDDVVTTGATAEAMAKALKQQGVKNVEIWAIARTPL